MRKVLAIDMGATSIRAVIGYIEDNKLIAETIHRFKHELVEEQGRKRWQWEKILNEITDVIIENKDDISSIGIDTWGVDFGLIDKNGELIENPISYRDLLHENGLEISNNHISNEKLFLETGNQILGINTLFQLLTYRDLNKDKFDQVDKILLLPDLINYYLTSQINAELTIASTTQMLDIKNRKWNIELLKSFAIGENLLPRIIKNKSIVGNTSNSKLESLRKINIPVISVASHDTASAVYLTESYRNKEYAFLSSGTWSLIGCCTENAIINEKAYENDLTNEIGFDSKNMFFKNITGLYLIERLKKELTSYYNLEYDYNFITKLVINTDPFKVYIDTEYKDFTNEEIPIIDSIEEYLKNTNQNILEDKTEYLRVIYEGLVFKYMEIIDQVESLIGYKFKGIHIIGGGSKASFLCEMIADALQIKVIAGPDEATAMGNILAQLSTIEDESINYEEVISNSYEIKEYNPRNNNEWIKKYKMIKIN